MERGFFPALITNQLYAPAALDYEQPCPDDSVRFWVSNTGGARVLRWDMGEPTAAAPPPGPAAAHRYAAPGRYVVRATLSDGRELRREIVATAGAADFTQANVFTPNGDGLNDTFEPLRGARAEARLRVYNRWGRLLYDARDPTPRWDGAEAPAGLYYYHLEYPNCQGRPAARRGTVTLIR